MTYQPLARTYRPALFSELVGQEAVAKALANAIAMGREPHALIFTGVRGVGKTTIARLYAKALNCPNRQNGEPCNTCDSCTAITNGNHEDVLEIDGASNTGVGDVRALQEAVGYRPQRSAFKVYIIDEVHMLSQAAFNALLKTLEEPPAHVVFVFATTEMQKVPETILSRCQAFFLKKLPPLLIFDRLKSILMNEQIPADDKAIAIIAREGHGSMRDALTLLDQAIALSDGQVTLESLGPIVSNLSSTPYLDLLAALTARDAGRAMHVVATLDQGGAEFSAVVEETAMLARHAFVIQGLGVKALDVALLGLDGGELASLETIAREAATHDLNRIFRTLVKCRLELDGSALDRYVLENYLFEWCFDPGLPDIETLLANQAKPSPPARPVTGAMKSAVSELKPSQPTPPVIPSPTAPTPTPARQLPTTWRHLVDTWKQAKPLQARKLEETHALEYSDSRIVLAVSEESYASKCLLQKDEQVKIRDQLKELFGFAGSFIVMPQSEAKTTTGQGAEAMPETILNERAREDQEKRQRLKDEAANAPFTKDLLQALGGTLEDVRIPGNDHPNP